MYFTVETVATVGFGDFSFAGQSSWLEGFGVLLIVAGTTLVTTIFALLTNVLVSRRIERSLGQGSIRRHGRPRGAGRAGSRRPARPGRAASAWTGGGGDRVRRAQPLCSARPLARRPDRAWRRDARADVALGQHRRGGRRCDLDERRPRQSRDGPSRQATCSADAGRKYRSCCACSTAHSGIDSSETFKFHHVWSTSALAAPWFVGAVLGLEVLATFYVRNQPFLVARLTARPTAGSSDWRCASCPRGSAWWR